MRRHQLVSRAFRPAAPVDDEALFAGRSTQMVRVDDAIQQPGQHAAIYGGRGVGKTSLAKVMVKSLNAGPIPVVALHYTSQRHGYLRVDLARRVRGLLDHSSHAGHSASHRTRSSQDVPSTHILDLSQVTTDSVRRALFALSASVPLAIFIDEFDLPSGRREGRFCRHDQGVVRPARPRDIGSRRGLPTTSTALSRHTNPVRRSLADMPNMSGKEPAEIIYKRVLTQRNRWSSLPSSPTSSR